MALKRDGNNIDYCHRLVNGKKENTNLLFKNDSFLFKNDNEVVDPAVDIREEDNMYS